MKVCPVCGEVYRQHAVRCLAHDVLLRAWNETPTETTTDTQLGVVTDVDGHARAIVTPFEAGIVAGELNAPWPTPECSEAALAETPLVHVSDEVGRVREPTRGRLLGGRYRLSRQIGVGGYGAVFAAEDLVTHERVAIKVLTPAASQCTEMITRFHREAIAASRARHPHIVDVADFDVDDDGSHYIVMEYLDGSDLAAVLEGGRRLPPARALVIAAQCARGLAAAHRVGVLHRDLKPANVFLVRRPDGGDTVKIIDFGISKLTRTAGDYTDVTSASKVVGTPCYMSPEQARGATLDARTDVYALGVMLFEMLVGERPFTGRSPIEILTKHIDAPRVRPSAWRPELAACPGLDALVLRALAAAPVSRFRSMEELGEAIVACLRAIDPAAAEHATEITGELTDPGEPVSSSSRAAARSSRRGLRSLGLGVAATVMVALAVASGARDRGDAVANEVETAARPARSRTPAVAVPVPVPVTIAAAPTTSSAPHVVRLTSAPAGATVRRDGEVIGETPLRIEIEPGKDTLVLALDAPGYRGRRIVVARDRDAIEVVLERAARRGGRPRRASRPAPAGAATLGVEEW